MSSREHLHFGIWMMASRLRGRNLMHWLAGVFSLCTPARQLALSGPSGYTWASRGSSLDGIDLGGQCGVGTFACRTMVRGRDQDATMGRRGHHTEEQEGICVMNRIGRHYVSLSSEVTRRRLMILQGAGPSLCTQATFSLSFVSRLNVPANAKALSVSREFHCTSQHFPLQQLIPRVGSHLVKACTQFILH